MQHLRSTLLATAMIALFTTHAALAQEDPVVAKVNGQDIFMSEVSAATLDLPAQYQQMPQEVLYRTMLDRVIDARLISVEAEKEGLDDDPDVQRQVERARASVLAQAYIVREVEAAASEEEILRRFDVLKNDPQYTFEEVSARHILVETEEEANEIIAELDAGGDFIELAKARSTGPSGPAGGDLGFFRKEQMVPEFSDAAFAIEPGTYGTEPVKSNFGWHVIKVDDKKFNEATLAQLRPQIEQEISQDVITARIEALRASNEIEKFTPTGEPLPE